MPSHFEQEQNSGSSTDLHFAEHRLSSRPMADRSDAVILLAEDDEDHVLMFFRALRQLGIPAPVQVVSNGEEAIGYLQGKGRFSSRSEFPLPDLLLLDLRMPRTDGFEVLEWLRDQPHFSPVRVVVLTTSRDSTDVRRAYDLGAASFLTKPVDFTEFRNAIKVMYTFWRLNRSGKAARG